MKRFWSTPGARAAAAALALGLACSSGGGAPADGDPPGGNDLPVTLTDELKLTGAAVSGDQVVFVFDEATYGLAAAPAAVAVRGSFNGWSASSAWPLAPSSTAGVWFLVRPLADAAAPGNSGLPEFKFVTTDYLPPPAAVPAGHVFQTNLLVMGPGDDPAQVMANDALASTVYRVDHWDLADPADQQTFANFRQAPGLTHLYRSYHPFKQSKASLDSQTGTDAARVETVKALLEGAGIRSIVALSGDEAPATGESVSAYQQAIISAGDELYLTTSYNVVYYQSRSFEFGTLVRHAVEFIVSDAHPAPFLVHCRLGTDRTGVLVAVLAGLSGSSWSEIAADYQRSNEVGMREFRDAGILRYSFRRLLGADPATVPDLKAALTAYFVDGGYLTQAQVDALGAKLR